jgi:hypothetical protein
VVVRVAVDGAGQASPQPVDVLPAVIGPQRVDVAPDLFGVALRPVECDLERDGSDIAGDDDRLGMNQRGVGAAAGEKRTNTTGAAE